MTREMCTLLFFFFPSYCRRSSGHANAGFFLSFVSEGDIIDLITENKLPWLREFYEPSRGWSLVTAKSNKRLLTSEG